jgi:superoxide dismutase, Cu-Zn family
MSHSGRENVNRHLGDLGNIEADHYGHANIRLLAKDLNLSGPGSIVGRALVVHSKEDDLGRGSNPESKINGNSGSRVACGVVVLVP